LWIFFVCNIILDGDAKYLIFQKNKYNADLNYYDKHSSLCLVDNENEFCRHENGMLKMLLSESVLLDCLINGVKV